MLYIIYYAKTFIFDIQDILEGHLVFDVPQLHWKGFKSGNDQFRVATRTGKLQKCCNKYINSIKEI